MTVSGGTPSVGGAVGVRAPEVVGVTEDEGAGEVAVAGGAPCDGAGVVAVGTAEVIGAGERPRTDADARVSLAGCPRPAVVVLHAPIAPTMTVSVNPTATAPRCGDRATVAGSMGPRVSTGFYPRGMRRNRRPKTLAPRPLGFDVAEWNGTSYVVRPVSGAAAAKRYRCPGCDHEIAPGTPHRVVWPQDAGGADARRHWHTACWQARTTRGTQYGRHA